MDARSRKAFLVRGVISSQNTIDAIQKDLKNPDNRTYMQYEDECMLADELEFQRYNIIQSMELLAL